MEDRFQIAANGQSVLQADINALGEGAGLADDRVFAELLRLLPYNGSSPSRGVLPYAHPTSGTVGTIVPNGASSTVLVNPFRAFVGPRTAVGTDAKKNWRDARSAIGIGSTTLAQTTPLFAANSSGNPRWDLVYAAVSVDAPAPTVVRKVKDPTTKVVSSQSVVTIVRTTIVIGIQPGTAAASPVWPAAPNDAAGVYYIPLAYVRIPNGFGATSTVLPTDIAFVAPLLKLSRATGGATVSVADQQFNATTAQQQAWGSTGTRPKVWVPPEVGSAETVMVVMDLSDGSSANWSHANNGLIDSRDWRGRLCKFTVLAETPSGGSQLAWNGVVTPGDVVIPNSGNSRASDNTDDSGDITVGFGQTIQRTEASANISLCAISSGSKIIGQTDGITVGVYCDHADGGKLKAYIPSGTSSACVFLFWLEFTGPYTNK